MFSLALMRRFSFGLALAIAILVFSTNSIAQESTTKFPYLAKVTQKQIAVRAGADSRYYLFGELFENDYVQVVAHKSGWARVRTYGPTFKDFYGFVKLEISETRRFLVDSDSKTGLTNGPVLVFGPNLDDKADPARSWKPIARLTTPTKLKILDAKSTDSLLIFKVELPRESEGWINLTNLQMATIDEITSWEDFITQANKPQVTDDAIEEGGLAVADNSAQQPLLIDTNETRTPSIDETAANTVEADRSDESPITITQQTPDPIINIIPNQNQPEANTETPSVADTSSANRPEFVDTPAKTIQEKLSITESISRLAEAIANTEDQINRPEGTSNNPIEPNQVLGTYLDPINPVRVSPSAAQPPASVATNQQTQASEVNSANQPAQVEVEPKPKEKPKVYISKADVRGLSLEDLELMYTRLLREPKQTAKVDPLRQMYAIFAAEFAKKGVETSHANSRAAQLEIWAELQEKMIQIHAMRTRAKAGVKEANEAALDLEKSGDYQAVGILVSSIIYDGKRLPKLFRLKDQITGRTIGYLAPSEDFDLVKMIGEVLGIKGERSYDGGLRLNVFTPEKIDILTDS